MLLKTLVLFDHSPQRYYMQSKGNVRSQTDSLHKRKFNPKTIEAMNALKSAAA